MKATNKLSKHSQEYFKNTIEQLELFLIRNFSWRQVWFVNSMILLTILTILYLNLQCIMNCIHSSKRLFRTHKVILNKILDCLAANSIKNTIHKSVNCNNQYNALLVNFQLLQKDGLLHILKYKLEKWYSQTSRSLQNSKSLQLNNSPHMHFLFSSNKMNAANRSTLI